MRDEIRKSITRNYKKGERTIKILQALDGYTKYTQGNIPSGLLTQIGKDFGVTRERVRQIAKKSGLYTPTHKIKFNRECENCGKPFKGSHNRKTCSVKCAKELRLITYWTRTSCKNCQKDIKVLKSKLKSARAPIFCSKRCQGLYIATHYGFQKGEGRTALYFINPALFFSALPTPFTAEDISRVHGYTLFFARNIARALVVKGFIEIVGKKPGKGSAHLYIEKGTLG